MASHWAGVALIVASGCGGDPFTGMTPDAEALPGDGALTQTDGASTQSPDASADVTSSPCGVLRDGDAREVCFPSTAFAMGSNSSNLGATFADHTPSHQVSLATFALDAFEVTVARYRACVRAGRCARPSGGTQCTYTDSAGSADSMPVLCVAWSLADTFCKWDGRHLPTEAQWELAARGTAGRAYPWGDTFDCSRAVIGAYPGGACSVYSGPISAFGMGAGATPEQVYNLAGNAGEWVADWFGSYRPGMVSDPTGPASGSMKVVRGGAFSNPPAAALGYARMALDPTITGPWGFRCARAAQ